MKQQHNSEKEPRCDRAILYALNKTCRSTNIQDLIMCSPQTTLSNSTDAAPILHTSIVLRHKQCHLRIL